MKIQDVLEYIRTCPREDLQIVTRTINARIKENRKEAKAHFSVGDPVTCNDPRWYYGTGYIEKINPKNIIVNCSGRKINVSPSLLIKINQ